MRIKRIHNISHLKETLLRQFIQSLDDDVTDDAIDHYAELLAQSMEEEIVSNDNIFIEMHKIMSSCMSILNDNTIRFVCNGIIADIPADLELG
jgi:hypothetical protein